MAIHRTSHLFHQQFDRILRVAEHRILFERRRMGNGDSFLYFAKTNWNSLDWIATKATYEHDRSQRMVCCLLLRYSLRQHLPPLLRYRPLLPQSPRRIAVERLWLVAFSLAWWLVALLLMLPFEK